MHAPPAPSPTHTVRDPLWWHLPLLFALAVGFESLFLHHGINRLDESWPLYAAMRLHAGGALYRDVLWPFPPGHVLPAWIAYGLDPPGFVLSRAIYGAFDVLLCLALYALGRRVTSPSFALLGAALMAVAAPRGHTFQLLFGYRYLLFSALALLAFAHRLRGGDARWMGVAGLCAGTALAFRLTPAFAVSCALGVAVVAADRDWRRWLRDGSWFGAGLALVALPVVGWFALDPGLAVLWREVVVHPLAMLQPLPPPEIRAPQLGDRASIYRWFTAVQLRAWWLLYAGYAAWLAFAWIRALRRRQPFEHALLLAIAIWGGVFFIRSLGRSDEAHLDSTLPPICLLLAHLLGACAAALWPRRESRARARPLAELGVGLAALAGWVFLTGADLYLDARRRGIHPIRTSREWIGLTSRVKASEIDRVVRALRAATGPDDVILNMSPTPLFHVLTGRTGPGSFDVVMPGTFLDEAQELAFVARLRAAPPAAVVWPVRDFDDMPERAVTRAAPHLSRWVLSHYRPIPGRQRQWRVMLPRGADSGG